MAVEQLVVRVTDRPQPDGAHLGVRVIDVVAVPGYGLVIEQRLTTVERLLVAVLVADTERAGISILLRKQEGRDTSIPLGQEPDVGIGAGQGVRREDAEPFAN